MVMYQGLCVLSHPGFSIIDAAALAPGLVTREQWLEWAHTGVWPMAEGMQTPHLPMMVARRMSQGARLAVELALSMMEQHPVDGAVFASRHGELDRSITLLQALAAQRALSPTDFSQSVHNTSAGLASIQGQHSIPMSSLAAGEGSFAAALHEAIGMLADGLQKVLVVAFEGRIPTFSQPWLADEMPPRAVALVLAKGGEWQGCRATTSVPREMDGALSCWRAQLMELSQFTVFDGRQGWLWQRN